MGLSACTENTVLPLEELNHVGNYMTGHQNDLRTVVGGATCPPVEAKRT